MKKKILVPILLLVVTFTFILVLNSVHSKIENNSDLNSQSGGEVTQVNSISDTNYQQPVQISLISLIANPINFNGKYIRVVGFVRITFEGTAVYLHEEDYKFAITKNALWLEIARHTQPEYMRGDLKYVLIEGTFDASNKGHRGLFSGTITNIKRFEVRGE